MEWRKSSKTKIGGNDAAAKYDAFLLLFLFTGFDDDAFALALDGVSREESDVLRFERTFVRAIRRSDLSGTLDFSLLDLCQKNKSRSSIQRRTFSQHPA